MKTEFILLDEAGDYLTGYHRQLIICLPVKNNLV